METFPPGDTGAREASRERRSDSQNPKAAKAKKDPRGKTNSSSRGINWQRQENNSRSNYGPFSEARPDNRQKASSIRCDTIPFNARRQNRSIKAECFVNLVYEDDRATRRDKTYKPNNSRKTTSSMRRNVYTTENYMQANCQFVVDNSCSSLATKICEDPDFTPPWDTICEVRLVSSGEPNCPICMSKPIARRITVCGHLFCLPCIIHYFTVKAEKSVPCPICFTKIDASCIKPVSLVHCADYSVGDSITVVLSRCRKGTTIVESMDSELSSSRMSNVVFASKLEMISRLQVDKDQLKLLMVNQTGAETPDEMSFVAEAIKIIEGEIIRLEIIDEAHHSSLEVLGVSPPKPDNIVFYVDALHDQKPDVLSSVLIDPDVNNKDRIESPTLTLPAAAAASTVDKTKPGEIDNSYSYFYQSIDGQRIYSNSFNVRCLQKQFGHLSHCPTVLEGKILAIEYVNVTPEVRSKFRYLSHLPLFSHFQSVEIDLSNTLSSEVLEVFSDEMERRKDERTSKQNKEDAYSRRAGSLMERLTEVSKGITPIALDEPLVYDHAAFMADSPSLFSSEAPSESLPSGNPESPNNNLSTWGTSSSFARILTEGRPLDSDFPSLGSPPSIPPSPAAILSTSAPYSRASSALNKPNRVHSAEPFSKVKTVKWGSVATSLAPSPAPSKPVVPNPLNSDEEEELAYAAPEGPRTLADCLSGINLASNSESPSSGANWKKSKKKSEGRLLFASGRGHALLH